MPELGELLDRLDALERDEPRSEFGAAVRRAAEALAGSFEDLAVVRGGRIQLVLLRGPGHARVLVAPSASESDRASLLARLRRDERVSTLAAEILGLALVIPGEPLKLAHRTRQIVALGEQLVAAATS